MIQRTLECRRPGFLVGKKEKETIYESRETENQKERGENKPFTREGASFMLEGTPPRGRAERASLRNLLRLSGSDSRSHGREVRSTTRGTRSP